MKRKHISHRQHWKQIMKIKTQTIKELHVYNSKRETSLNTSPDEIRNSNTNN